jgi:hypothetical protein
MKKLSPILFSIHVVVGVILLLVTLAELAANHVSFLRTYIFEPSDSAWFILLAGCLVAGFFAYPTSYKTFFYKSIIPLILVAVIWAQVQYDETFIGLMATIVTFIVGIYIAASFILTQTLKTFFYKKF